MPSTLEGYFELMALCTEPAERGGAQISVYDFNAMMPWQLDALLEFKVNHRQNLKSKESNEEEI